MARIPFQKPKTIEWQILSDRYGRLVAEPFEKGYALTVGNSLRRTLLSIIPGAAVTWARVKGVKVDLAKVLTNIVIFDVSGSKRTAADICAELGKRGVLAQERTVIEPKQRHQTQWIDVEIVGSIRRPLGLGIDLDELGVLGAGFVQGDPARQRTCHR